METGNPTLEKVKELKQLFRDPQYSEDLLTVDAFEKTVKELIAREALAENAALLDMLKKYRAEVDQMDVELRTSDSEKLPDAKRDRLLDKKRLYEDFLASFDAESIRKQLEGVDKEVEAELAHARATVK